MWFRGLLFSVFNVIIMMPIVTILGGNDMHIEEFRQGNQSYLRLCRSKRVQNDDGTATMKKVVVKYLGPRKKFEDGKPDYMKRLRASFREGKPLIPELEPYVDKREIAPPTARYLEPRNVGYLFLDALLDGLGLAHVITLAKSRRQITYDLLGLFRLLVYGRVLTPDSKIQTFSQRENYVFPVSTETDWHAMYAALKELTRSKNALLSRAITALGKGGTRKTDLAFYDVTNYYFEIDENDADLIDENGNMLKRGSRKRGVSKENRKQPLIQMGLLMDQEGLPVSYDLFPGNTLDHLTLLPALDTARMFLQQGRLVVVADRGVVNYKNLAGLVQSGHGYVMSKSLKKCDRSTKDWILSPEGYHGENMDNFRLKSRIVTRQVTDSEGKRVSLHMKEVVYWSRRFYEREFRENESFLNLLHAFAEHPERYPVSRHKSLSRFVDSVEVDRDSGEVLDTQTVSFVNEDKVKEFSEFFGYYLLVTSEVDKTDEDVVDTYRGLTRIERCFRTMKSELKSRPVYVSTEDSIEAHFLTCFLALLLMRLIQRQILRYKGLPTTNTFDWEDGLSAERVQRALTRFQSNLANDGNYQLTRADEDIELIFDAFGMEPLGAACTYSELVQFKNQLKKKVADLLK